MSSSTELFFDGYWSFNVLKTAADNQRESVFWLPSPREKKNSKLTELIEYCQILSSSGANYGTEFSSTFGNYSTIINHINNRNGKCLVMYLLHDNTGTTSYAHAVVPIRTRTLASGAHEIILYDPDYPEQTRTATVSPDYSNFSYFNYNKAALFDVYDYNTSYNQILDLIWDIVTGNGTMNKGSDKPWIDSLNMLMVNSTKTQIIDKEGRDISGDLIKKGKASINKGFVVYNMPYGDYEIITDAKDRVSLVNSDVSITYDGKINKVVEVSFNKNKTIKSSISFKDHVRHDVNISVFNKDENKIEKTLNGTDFIVDGKSDDFSVKELT